jgi:hypothetical protein
VFVQKWQHCQGACFHFLVFSRAWHCIHFSFHHSSKALGNEKTEHCTSFVLSLNST